MDKFSCNKSCALSYDCLQIMTLILKIERKSTRELCAGTRFGGGYGHVIRQAK
jgi:hypothetical protein